MLDTFFQEVHGNNNLYNLSIFGVFHFDLYIYYQQQNNEDKSEQSDTTTSILVNNIDLETSMTFIMRTSILLTRICMSKGPLHNKTYIRTCTV